MGYRSFKPKRKVISSESSSDELESADDENKSKRKAKIKSGPSKCKKAKVVDITNFCIQYGLLIDMLSAYWADVIDVDESEESEVEEAKASRSPLKARWTFLN